MTTVVMTGGTAGLGLVAAERIRAQPGTQLLLGGRSGGVLPLDLGRLGSVREFARVVEQALGSARIDVLVLNAGIQSATNAERTEEGFEANFGVNHLGHYLLLRLLLPALADGATVVITASDTHDPRSNSLAAPRELDIAALAHPKEDGKFLAGFKAYSASKLCNVLTARALATAEPGLRVIAYNPGFTPGTALQRDWPWWARLAGVFGSLFRPVARLATVEQAGDALADLALGRVDQPAGRLYASIDRRQLTWKDPAELARRDDLARLLWDESARMVGLDPAR
jgi:NAD(P)-dependent dehydrogenase (short-subunit alcohol dehydrogenase family)